MANEQELNDQPIKVFLYLKIYQQKFRGFKNQRVCSTDCQRMLNFIDKYHELIVSKNRLKTLLSKVFALIEDDIKIDAIEQRKQFVQILDRSHDVVRESAIREYNEMVQNEQEFEEFRGRLGIK